MTQGEAEELGRALTSEQKTALQLLSRPADYGGRPPGDWASHHTYGWLVADALGWSLDDGSKVRAIIRALHDLKLTTLRPEFTFTQHLGTAAPQTTDEGNAVVAEL